MGQRLQVTPEGRVVGTTITDLNGHFEMIVNDPRNKLVFTKDGYQTVRSGISQGMRVLMISSDSSLTSSSYAQPLADASLVGQKNLLS